MLGTRDRRLLLEALRPPEGYALSDAVATTFTLDLMTLLTAPLAFTLFDWQDADGKPQADPLALLEALRRHAEHVHVFCQAGYVAVPPADAKLFHALEQSVIEIRRPEDGPFHPKVWVLRFTHAKEAVHYRVLVGTRNLTFDRSWDTLLVLEGDVRDGGGTTRVGPPLADFLRALPRLALHPPAAARAAAAIERMASELDRTDFDAPESFEGLAFQPLGAALWGALGLPPRKQPRWSGFTERVDRLLVVSPFLSPAMLKKLADLAVSSVLVSRVESLLEVPGAILRQFGAVYALSPNSEAEVVEGEGPDSAASRFGGLHAKLYVADQGSQATVWTGSANASGSLDGAGVEMLVRLRGAKRECGIDAILDGGDGRGALRSLLTPYEVPERDLPGDAVKRQLEGRLDELRAMLAGVGLYLVVESCERADRSRMRVELPPGARWDCPADTSLVLHTVMATRAAAVPWPAHGGGVDLGETTIEGLTTFIAFRATVRAGDRSLTDEFVLNLPCSSMPADRAQRSLRLTLTSSRHVMRFLLLLLSDGGLDARELLRGSTSAAGGGQDAASEIVEEGDLLEQMLRALHREPGRVDRVARLVEDLEASPDGKALLPPDLPALLRPILEVRRRLAP